VGVESNRWWDRCDLETPACGVRGELLNSNEIPAQELFDIRRGLIATAQPDHFWRRAAQGSRVRVIGVQRHQNEIIGLGVVPNGSIRGFVQPEQTHLIRIGIQIADKATEFEAQILIKQELRGPGSPSPAAVPGPPLAHPTITISRETKNTARDNALLWRTGEQSATSPRNASPS
jgi:hypothetical protein